MNKPENISGENVPTSDEINAAIKIITAATNMKNPTLGKTSFEQKLLNLHNWFASHFKYASIVLLATASLAIYTKSRPLFEASLVFYVLVTGLVIAMMIPIIIDGILSIIGMFKSPYASFLELVQTGMKMDLVHVEALAKCPKHVLEYALVHYQHERNSYEKRSGMIAGAIEKVGIFPALAGLTLLVWNLTKLPGNFGWAGFFGPLLFFFYLMAMASAAMTQKMDRVIALLEFSIQSRK